MGCMPETMTEEARSVKLKDFSWEPCLNWQDASGWSARPGVSVGAAGVGGVVEREGIAAQVREGQANRVDGRLL